MSGEEVGKDLQDIVGLNTSNHRECQAFPAALVQHGQHLQLTVVVRLARHDVIRPDVVASSCCDRPTSLGPLHLHLPAARRCPEALEPQFQGGAARRFSQVQ